MKLLRIYSFFVFCLFLLFTSCEEDVCYSCDETVDAWAHENLTTISLMSRIELQNLDLEKQRASFRTFSPSKKKEIWIDKLNHVKSKAQSNDEIQHLNILNQFVANLDFSTTLTSEQIDYLENWFAEGVLKFEWTGYYRISAFKMLGEVTKEEKEFNEQYLDQILSSNYEGPNLKFLDLMGVNYAYAQCDSEWCADCTFLGGTCLSGCQRTTTGCGWLFLQECTKNCSPPPPDI